MEGIGLIILLVLLPIFGGVFGFFIAKFVNWRRNRKIIKNAKEVLEGKRKNELEIEGVKYDARKFRLRDDHGHEFVIDLKGGGKKQDGTKEESYQEQIKREVSRQNTSSIGEDSRSIRKKKRNTRRIRRYG